MPIATGAALLSTSIGLWANPDPYQAERWGAGMMHVGTLGVGAMVLTECALPAANSACSGAATPMKRMLASSGGLEIGFQLSLLAVELLLPPPDPRAVNLAVHRASASATEYASVLAFLQQRERRRRVEDYVSFSWLALAPIGMFYFGSQLDQARGRTACYAAGAVFSAFTIAGLLYEVLRTPDDVRLQRGEDPNAE